MSNICMTSIVVSASFMSCLHLIFFFSTIHIGKGISIKYSLFAILKLPHIQTVNIGKVKRINSFSAILWRRKTLYHEFYVFTSLPFPNLIGMMTCNLNTPIPKRHIVNSHNNNGKQNEKDQPFRSMVGY